MKGVGIRGRLTLVYGILVLVALVVSGAAIVGLLQIRLMQRTATSLESKLIGVEAFLKRETTADTSLEQIPTELAEYASTQPEGYLIEVRNGDGKVLLSAASRPVGAMFRTREFDLFGRSYITEAAASLEPIRDAVHEVILLLCCTAPVLLLILGAVGHAVVGRSLARVDEMTTAARAIGVSNLDNRLLVSGNDELARLAEAWNEMLQRLQDSFVRMRRFTADAAHELRTPLTGLRATAELALRRERDADEYRAALVEVVGISGKIAELGEGLLTLARGDDADANAGGSSGIVDMRALIHEILDEMKSLFAAKEHRVEVALLPGPVTVRADATELRRLLAILLDNAQKYTPRKGRIEVALRSDESEIELGVSDTGCGVPEYELSRIFERFYRVDSSRDRETGGYGLGLAIARQIATRHRGSIGAANLPGGGMLFRFRMPK